jgi:integrase
MVKWMHRNGYKSQGIENYPPEAPAFSKHYNKGGRQVFVASRKAAQGYLAHLNNPLCAQTINNRISIIKAFLKHLHKDCKINNVIALPDPLSRRMRQLLPSRAMPVEELDILVESVMKLGITRYGMTPQQRVAYYMTAFYTMIRRRGLTELLIKNCHLDGEQPYIHVLPDTDKCRVERTVALPPCAVASIKSITEGRGGNERVWAIPINFNTMLRTDMRKAGIAITTDDGKFNCHSFRKSGATYYLKNSVPIHFVCEMGGWRNTNTLLKYYKQLCHQDYRSYLPPIFHKTEP